MNIQEMNAMIEYKCIPMFNVRVKDSVDYFLTCWVIMRSGLTYYPVLLASPCIPEEAHVLDDALRLCMCIESWE